MRLMLRPQSQKTYGRTVATYDGPLILAPLGRRWHWPSRQVLNYTWGPTCYHATMHCWDLSYFFWLEEKIGQPNLGPTQLSVCLCKMKMARVAHCSLCKGAQHRRGTMPTKILTLECNTLMLRNVMNNDNTNHILTFWRVCQGEIIFVYPSYYLNHYLFYTVVTLNQFLPRSKVVAC